MKLISLFLCIGVFALVSGYENDELSTKLKIGVIADRRQMETDYEKDTNLCSNVSLVWESVNYQEIFHIYGALRRLDTQLDVDFIVLLDYNPSQWSRVRLLDATNKTVIKFSSGISQNITIDIYNTSQYVNDTGIPEPDWTRQPLCKTDTTPSLIPSLGLLLGDTLPNTPVEILASLVHRQKWKSIYVFYETDTDRETQVFVDRLSRLGTAVTLYEMNKLKNLHRTLMEVYDKALTLKSEIDIVVLCRFQCLLKFFHTANQFDSLNKDNPTLLTHFARVLAIVYDYTERTASVLKAVVHEIGSVAIVAIPAAKPMKSQAFELRMKYLLADLQNSFNASSTDEFTEAIKQNILSWEPLNWCVGYLINTLLWTKSGRDFSVVGHADLDGTVHMQSDLLPNTKYGYSKRLFTITTIPYPPFVINASTPEKIAFEGVCMDLLQELAKILNFTYRLVDPPDNKWGSVDTEENGTFIFNGMIGQLQRREVDIAAAPLAIIPSRDAVVDFGYPVYHEYTTVVLKKPDPNARKWRTLLDPFKVNVLLFIGLALPVVTVLLCLLEKYNAFYTRPEHAVTRKTYGGLHHLHDSFWYMYGALLCQGGVHLPDSFAGRTFVSAWWLFCIIIVGTYSGNLIAFLTVSKDVSPFNTLEEMASMKGEYTWGTLGGTNWEVIFTSSAIPDFRKIGDAMIEFNKSDPGVFALSTGSHIKRVKEGGYAWIGDKTTIQLAMTTECDLLTIKEEFIPMEYAFAFQHNSPHTEMFSEQIMKSHEAGLFEIWRRKWLPKKNFCMVGAVPESKPISLADVQSAHYLCAIGFVVGTIAFILEVAIFKFKNRKHPEATPCGTMRLDENSAPGSS